MLSEDGSGTVMSGIRFEVRASCGRPAAITTCWASHERSLIVLPPRRRRGRLRVLCVRRRAAAGPGGTAGRAHGATTHWAFVACLQSFCELDVDTSNPRFVVSGNRLTGGGISSGLDESLQLITVLFGQAAAENVQVQTQYFLDPPVMGIISPPRRAR